MTGAVETQGVLDRALAARAFSAVAAETGCAAGPRWTYAAGRLGFDHAAPAVAADTIFDLASLTKVLAATTIALQLTVRGDLSLQTPVRDLVPAWRDDDRAGVLVRDLLEHSSGLPACREYFRTLHNRDAFVRAISAEPLEYAPRTRAVYSDLGFILLGVVLEQIGGGSLAEQFARWRAAIGLTAPLEYQPPQEWHSRTAWTQHYEARGRPLQGTVHDQNTAALGGVAAHAGLFGTAAAVGAAARWWLQRLQGHDDEATGVSASTALMFTRRSTVPGSSRALGWDTMLPASSCGTRMSSSAIGHTGFTGTSIWIDPELDAYYVLLTNRVLASDTSDEMQQVRRDFHDAATEALA
ncbi:MAG TPA: serine hydrolase domain-containing protein [Vicinamibacterales bacterium]|nr:serine hydrolase domain-containing protein [Vicinamibacterales bacterium]